MFADFSKKWTNWCFLQTDVFITTLLKMDIFQENLNKRIDSLVQTW